MQFPKWAPRDLCEVYQQMLESSDGALDPFTGLLGKLVGQSERSDDLADIKRVWQAFRKRGGPPGGPLKFAFLVHFAAFGPRKREAAQKKGLRERSEKMSEYIDGHVIHPVELVPNPVWELMKRSERYKRMTDIYEAAGALFNLIEDTPFDRSPYRFFSDVDAKQLLDLLNRDYLQDPEGYSTNQEFLDSFLGPRMSQLLFDFRLIAYAEHMKSCGRNPGYDPGIVNDILLPNPGIKHADRVYFIRSISRLFRRTYDSPLHGVVAALGRVVLDDREIDEDMVRRLSRALG